MQLTTPKSLTKARGILFATTALSLAVASSAYATDPWVSTQTKAFLPLVQSGSSTQGVTAATTRSTSAATTDLAASQVVHVTVGLKLRNENQLDQEISFLQSGGSRQFLTPAQFAQQYSPTQQQVDAVVAHLKKTGFTNINVAPNRLFVTADGTPSAVHSAFNTTLKGFKGKDGRNVFANATDAQVPSSLSNVVQTVLGLQNVVTAHTYHKLNPVLVSPSATAGASTLITKAATTPVEKGHYPLEFSTLYGGGTTPTASATTVGIITSGTLTQTISDLKTFTTKNSLAAVTTSTVKTGATGRTYSAEDPTEWNLDSQSIVGAAGGAVQKIIFYTAPDDATTDAAFLDDISNAFNRAVTDNTAKVINVSLGWCESDASGTSVRVADNNIFKQAVAQGQTFSVSSGDEGAYECSTTPSGYGGKPNGTNYTVGAPASSPYVLAIGGTALYTAGTGVYSSETTWNEGLAAASPTDSVQRLWATGGGYSTLEAAPTWQTSAITGSTKRAVPDIAFDAASNSGAILYINGSTTFTQGGSTYYNQVGGTSLASPLFVGFYARIQSANNNALGFPAASIYKYFPTNTSFLHDVTTGNNGSGSYPGFTAKAGWDAVTGFGSFDVTKLNTFIKATPDFAH
ncbi:S53 family peptidase [Aquirhabdus parva]|uniref:Peptidase S53 n=1 Tax=Aquirhabdus parva TaxID=2283318 RepID=A0A345PBQ2_9GAMM|nr:S53 family peptidase [Aquirhabdus parva]AXI04711.1 peptidase S53 [Aquirhabdus parva]